MLIDVDVSLGPWPFQCLAPDTGAGLAEHLQSHGITTALVGSAAAAFHPDPHDCNQALFRELAPHAALLPVPVLDPSLPGWEMRLQEYARHDAVRAVKVLPGYHQYTLTDPCAAELAAALVELGLALFVQVRLEDERNQYPPLRLACAEPATVAALATATPQLTVVCLCAYMPQAVALTQAAPNVHVDLAGIETLDTLATLLQRISPAQVLFGSHTPFQYTRAACNKLAHAHVDADVLAQVGSGNAHRLLRLP